MPWGYEDTRQFNGSVYFGDPVKTTPDFNSPAEQFYRRYQKEQADIKARPVSPALAELYKRRDTVRGQLKDYGKSELADQARGTGRVLAGVDMLSAKRGLYSTTVRNAERNRANEAGMRDRANLQNQIETFKADTENTLTGDIAKMLSDEEDRRQGYAYQVAQGRASADAQNRSAMFGLAGTLGGGGLAGYSAGRGGGGGGTSPGALQGMVW